MKMRPLVLAAAAAAFCGAIPASAACEFTNATESFELHTGDVDPYGGDFTETASASIDTDCDIVYVEIDTTNTLQRTISITDEIPFTPTVTNGSAVAGTDLWELSAAQTAVNLSFAVDLDGNGTPRSKRHDRDMTLRLYADQNKVTLIDTLSAEAFLTVAEVMTISLTGIAGNAVNLGDLTPGQTTTNTDATLHAVSNDPHQITFDSANGWKITQVVAGDATYEIPYTLSVAGELLNADPDTISGLDSTGSGGVGRILSFVVSPTGDLRAGNYEDSVTITISGE